jgi:hypothetical protein
VDASPVRVIRRRQRACAASLWRCHLRPPGRSEAIGWTGNYRRIRHDRPDETHALHRAPLLRFYFPSAHTSRVARVRGGQPPDDPASAFCFALAVFAMARSMRCSSRWRTCGVGRSMTFRVIEKTRLPSPSTSRAGVSGETVHHAREKPNHIKRHRFGRAVSLRSCTDASFSAVFRYPSQTSTALPDDFGPPSFLRFSPGGAPGILALRRFAPADR